MIGLILGTSEGKTILSKLNETTSDILISTATTYGGELLKDYKYKILNDRALSYEELKNLLIDNKVDIIVDASHPYALEISKTSMSIASELNIEYVRYERESTLKDFPKNSQIIEIEDYTDLKQALGNETGNILNTTGSRNLDKILNLQLPNRIVHRVLPSIKVMEECFNLGIKVEDLIFIKGPISYQFNCAFIKEYQGKVLLTKDSGPQGGTYEKIKAALDMGLKVIVIGRRNMDYGKTFSREDELVQYVNKIIG